MSNTVKDIELKNRTSVSQSVSQSFDKILSKAKNFLTISIHK